MNEPAFAIRILDPAQGELEEIARLYLSLAGKDSSKAITGKIYSTLERLPLFPLSGPCIREPELRNLGYRFVTADRYVIIYRLIGNTVFVYHIFDGRSDYPTLFRSELFH